MREIGEILRRQAEEQRRLRDLPWPEKVRMVEQARHAIETLRKAPVVRESTGGDEAKKRSG